MSSPGSYSDSQSQSSMSPKITAWPKKVGDFITRKSLKHSELREEFNRRNAILYDKGGRPYYKGGLTDSSLVIYQHTSASSSRKSISFIVKVQQYWSSRLSFSSKQKSRFAPNHSSSSSSLLTTTMTIAKELGLQGKDVIDSSMENSKSTALLAKEKPLRERVSEPPSLPPLSPPPKVPILNEEDTQEMEDQRVYVWADKYRPVALKDFICNRNKAIELQALAKADHNCGHFIFEGLPGVGKRTMIWALLREAFGPDRVKTTEECKEFNLEGEGVGSIQVHVMESPQHVEVDLSDSDLKGYEKNVIIGLINETNIRLSKKALKCNHDNCRAIILYEAEKLSADALLYIRWLLERYRGCNKVFFCCNDVSELQPILSICTVIKLLPPSTEEIVEVLEFIAQQEGIELLRPLAEKIANNSNNNLRQAIRSFEATWHSNYPFTEDQEIVTGWEDDIAKIAKNIIEDQSPKQLYIIRGKLQNLIDHNVSPKFILKTLAEELKKHLDGELQTQIDYLYENYDWDDYSDTPFPAFARNRNKEKNVLHFMKIEECIAKFMSRYKGSVMNNKGV